MSDHPSSESGGASSVEPSDFRQIELPQLDTAERQGDASDEALTKAMRPVLDDVILDALRENPKVVINIVYPVIGAAIRKSIGASLKGLVEGIEDRATSLFSFRKLRWRLRSWKTGVPYGQIVLAHSLVYRVEEVLLIHRRTGMLLAGVSASPDDTRDRELVSSMLTAIEDFARDSFELESDHSLTDFSMGDFNVLIRSTPQVLLAAAVRGTPGPEVGDLLDEAAETIHGQYLQELEGYQGEENVFASALPLVEACLVSKADKPRSTPLIEPGE